MKSFAFAAVLAMAIACLGGEASGGANADRDKHGDRSEQLDVAGGNRTEGADNVEIGRKV